MEAGAPRFRRGREQEYLACQFSPVNASNEGVKFSPLEANGVCTCG